MKHRIAGVILFCTAVAIGAQTHNSVPIDDPVYSFIDTMILRGAVRRDVMARPWPRSKVLALLREIRGFEDLNSTEADYVANLIERIDLSDKHLILEQGAVDVPSDLFPAKLGVAFEQQLNTAIKDDPAITSLTMFRFYLAGDIPGSISYDVNVKMGLYSVQFDAYEPYTYTREWDGAPYHLVGYQPYGFPSELSGGLEIQSEIIGSYWDDRLWLRFGRLRRDWGSFGSGNLFLASQARPFTALDLTFNPWKWLSVSALTGSLNYGIHLSNDDGRYPNYQPQPIVPPTSPVYSGSKNAASVQQNSYSLLLIEVMPTEQFYLAFYDAAVWTKRYELDYIYPLQSKFFGQEGVGDFDNMMIGGTAAFLAPGYGQAWASLYIDEMDLLSDHFFSRDRNMFAFQFGTTVPIQLFSLGKINLQYTKIEPYVYTHPPVDSPTYGDVDEDGDQFDMETYYMNNGEPLGFYQPPNSDELRLEISTMPVLNVMTGFTYRMIRHGATTGTYRVDGSSYYDYIDYYQYSGGYPSWQDDPLYHKNFLEDGAYEWQHVFGLEAVWSGNLGKIPYRMGIGYDFIWSYFTNYAVTGNLQPYEDGEYKSSISNLISLEFKLYP